MTTPIAQGPVDVIVRRFHGGNMNGQSADIQLREIWMLRRKVEALQNDIAERDRVDAQKTREINVLVRENRELSSLLRQLDQLGAVDNMPYLFDGAWRVWIREPPEETSFPMLIAAVESTMTPNV